MANFDLQKTATLERLFRAPREQRDSGWIASFYAAAPEASLAAHEQQLINGPDGFPYFALYLPEEGKEFSAFCIAQVLDNCLEHGVGCVINPDKPQADWVFTFGNLWSLKSFNTFDATPPNSKPQDSIASGTRVLMAAPSDAFLPPFARNIIRHYLSRFGVNEPRVLLISDAQSTPSQSLAFSVYREDLGEEVFNQVMGGLKSWVLPPHYGLVALPKNSEYASHFVPL